MTSRRKYYLIAYTVLGISMFTLNGFNNANLKIEKHLSEVINLNSPDSKNMIWVFFTDKGENSDNILLSPQTFLTAKSIERRTNRIKEEKIFDEKDIPVNIDYINILKLQGIKIKNKSKWFNAVSCYADKVQIELIAQENFVKRIEPVRKYSRRSEPDNVFDYSIPETEHSDNPLSINYGQSFNQSNLINVPSVHELGYTGEGVLIASFDAGFDNLQHVCFDRIRQKGLRTYDFVNHDTIVANGQGRLGEGSHGTRTLSLVAGYDPGWLVSPAFDSKYILAKTENTESETPLEEDNWIAAAEWADSLGADIITSSLGYMIFDPPYKSYTWQDMNGNTARITIAADIAVSKGIIVVTSAGNSGNEVQPNTLNAPADGDSVITVGAVFLNKKRASFSSYGPTVDGRIKPDVMALGVNNYTARFGAGGAGYINSATGTSLSTPMVAGVCALILSANQNLSPIEVRNILRNTSDSSFAPNSMRGWGVVNAYDAVTTAININNVSDYRLEQNFPNPFNPTTTFRFTLTKNSNISLIIYNLSGREISKVIDNVFYTSGNKNVKIDFGNTGLSSGIYFYSLIANGVLIDSKKMAFVK